MSTRGTKVAGFRARLRERPRLFAAALALLGALATCALAARIDDYYAHGLTADWYVTHDGERQRLARTVEERPQFRNEHRTLERYLTHWDERKLGIPSTLPDVDTRLHGTLVVPVDAPGGRRRLVVDHSGEVEVTIDGVPSEREPPRVEDDLASPRLGQPIHRVRSEVLEPGEHEVAIEWRTVMQNPGINWDRTPDVHLRLLWAIEEEVLPDPGLVMRERDGPDEAAENDAAASDAAENDAAANDEVAGDADVDGGEDAEEESPEEAPEDDEEPPANRGITHLTQDQQDALENAVEAVAHHPMIPPVIPGAREGGSDAEDGAPSGEDDEDAEDGEDAEAERDDEAEEVEVETPEAEAPILYETRYEDVPQDALTPVRGDGSRTWLWAFGILIALFFGGLLAWTAMAWARAGEAFPRRAFLTACFLLTVLAVPLRTYEYTSAPDFRENMDELFAMWNGWQLLEDGTTRGWSLWDAYYGSDVTRDPLPYWRRFPTTTIQPYFEHPPLFHLMAGAAVHIGGAEHFAHAKHAHGRIVPIALSIIALWLTIALGVRLAGRRAALLAGLLQATLPIITLQSRAVKGEALIAVLLPALLLFYLKWRRSKKTRHLVFAAMFAGAAALAKLPAVALVIALAAMSVTEIDQDGWPATWKARSRRALRELKPAFIVLASGFAVSSLVLIVAASDWHGFWHAQSMQATIRLVSPDALGQFIYDPAINHNRVGRAFLVFLWMGTFVALFKAPRRLQSTLAIPLVVYTITLALPAGTWHYGWYFLPLYPLLCIGAGIMLRDLFEKPALIGGLLVVGLLTLYAVQLTIDPELFMHQENWRYSRRLTWGIALGVLAPVGAAQVFRHVFFRRLAQGALGVALAIYVVASAHFTLLYDETSRDVYDYDWGKPGTPVPGGRRDPLDGAFEIPVDAQEPEFSVPPR